MNGGSKLARTEPSHSVLTFKQRHPSPPNMSWILFKKGSPSCVGKIIVDWMSFIFSSDYFKNVKINQNIL